jgi:GeoRSP system SPASM domain protein
MELELPISVYWDLAPCEPLCDSLLRVCNEILECRPLILQLFDPSPDLSQSARAVLDRFKGTPVAVTLTIPYSSQISLAGAAVEELGVKELLLYFDAMDSLQNTPRLVEAGISFSVNRNNWHELPEIVHLCRENGWNRLVLPMQRLYDNDVPFFLSIAEQLELQHALEAVGDTQGINLTIHDPFLWKAFNPVVPFPQGGCQAANTMIAISSAGAVYPCPSLPVQLGVLGQKTLKEIIVSPAKKDFRRKLLEIPAGCSECAEIQECRGGCRGRAYVQHGTLDGIDNACR